MPRISTRKNGSILILLVLCFLVSARDTATELVMGEGVSAEWVLAIYSCGTVLLSSLLALYMNIRRANVEKKPLLLKDSKARLRILYLGISTGFTYLITVLAIRQLGSPIFDLVDWVFAPLLAVLFAWFMTRDKPLDKLQIFGLGIGAVGTAAFLLIQVDIDVSNALELTDKQQFVVREMNELKPDELIKLEHVLKFEIELTTEQKTSLLKVKQKAEVNRPLWLLIAFLSPVLTAVALNLQSALIKEHKLGPEQALFWRFPLAAIGSVIWLVVSGSVISVEHFIWLTLITVFFFFSPMYLLCLALVRTRVGPVAGFLFLIPVFTFLLAAIFIRETRMELMNNPEIAFWGLLVILGLVVMNSEELGIRKLLQTEKDS